MTFEPSSTRITSKEERPGEGWKALRHMRPSFDWDDDVDVMGSWLIDDLTQIHHGLVQSMISSNARCVFPFPKAHGQ